MKDTRRRGQGATLGPACCAFVAGCLLVVMGSHVDAKSQHFLLNIPFGTGSGPLLPSSLTARRIPDRVGQEKDAAAAAAAAVPGASAAEDNVPDFLDPRRRYKTPADAPWASSVATIRVLRAAVAVLAAAVALGAVLAEVLARTQRLPKLPPLVFLYV